MPAAAVGLQKTEARQRSSSRSAPCCSISHSAASSWTVAAPELVDRERRGVWRLAPRPPLPPPRSGTPAARQPTAASSWWQYSRLDLYRAGAAVNRDQLPVT
jgi:hypothetical protein